jgi:type IV secretion system protein VirB8
MKRDPSLEGYFAQAQSWEADRVARASTSERRAWMVAGSTTILALLSVLAVVGLTPLKEPIPEVIRVDNTTGVVDVVPVYHGTESLPEAVTRHLLTQHVTARERYFYGTAEADYDLVAAQSSSRLNEQWAAAWDRHNPQSPLNRYKDGTSIRVQIRSVTFLRLGSGRQNLAQVRFTRFVQGGNSAQEQPSQWISTVEYAYGEPSADNKVRALNPLGLRILEYHREPEVAGTPDSGRIAP